MYKRQFHIRARVQKQVGLLAARHHYADGRALDALQALDNKRGARQQRASGTGRDKRVALALGQKAQAHHHGGIFFMANGRRGLVMH